MRRVPRTTWLTARLLQLTLALCLGWSSLVRADQAPTESLAALVARVLSYERTLTQRAGESVDVIVLYDPRNAAAVAESAGFEKGFRALAGATVQGLALRAQLVAYDPGALDRALENGGDVLVVCSGLEAQLLDIAREARERNVLTVGVRREHAKHATTLAVILEDGRPKILANLSHANAEGVQLSAQLLRRAEVL